MISEAPERKDISTCWSTRPICINEASIKEYKVHNKGQCAPLTRSLCQRAHTSKSSRCCRGCGTFPPTPGWETNGTKPQPRKVLPGQKRKAALRDLKRGENAKWERRAPSYWVSGAPWNFQQLPVTTNTHAHKYNLNGLYHLCKSFVLGQAEDLGICWRSSSNRLPAPCAADPAMFGAAHTEEKPEIVLTTAAESYRSHCGSF